MANDLIQRIESFISKEGGSLGRHINHDLRSLDFNIEKVLPVGFSKIMTRTQIWKRWAACWDQGNIGDCVGNSVAGLLMTDPFFHTIKRGITEQDAIQIYSLATKLDPWASQGVYPPVDRGTDGMDGMKAAHKLGYLFAYYHIFDFQILLRYLSWVGPVIFGLNWYTGFDTPSSSGVCTFGSTGDTVRGGHEVEIIGVDTVAQTIRFANSWGPTWADHGCGQFSWIDFRRLMAEQGDLTVGIPNR